jgi:hypothetical protein
MSLNTWMSHVIEDDTMEPITTGTRAHDRVPSNDELKQLLDRTGVDAVVSTGEAAALLRVAPQTMRRWACEGSGPIRPRRMFGRLRWAVADINRVLNGETAAA